jgi:hypothetical protein
MTRGSLRWFLLLPLFAALAACGASSAQIQKAREAEYRTDALPQIFAGIREVMKDNAYDIEFDDERRGIVVSSWRWYSKEGMAKTKVRPRIEEGACLFRIGVELSRGPRGGIVLKVDGAAQGHKTGQSMAAPYDHDDADEPTWVRGRIDNLTVALYERLAPLQLAATP